MDILILGGTRFLGRAVVDAAIDGGHTVTLFNRGLTNPGLYPEVETVLGDRTSDLSALAGRHFDAVVDVAGYYPDVVSRSVDALRGAAGRYIFVSSLSVYADQSTRQDESGRTLTGDGYGARKAACKQVVIGAFGERVALVRAGMIVGPYDPTDRFAYWPRRYARGGTILLPGGPDDHVQFIDVRDLAGWIVTGPDGVYNVTGTPIQFGTFIDACRRFATGGVDEVWIPTPTLLAAGVDPWMGVPMWIGETGCEAINDVDVSKALGAGLTYRPLAETLAGAVASEPVADGLNAAEEQRLLATLVP